MNVHVQPPEIKPRSKRRGGLYVTDAEIVELLNVPVENVRDAHEMFEKDTRSGFPPKQRVWGNRRFWPAVLAWHFKVNGMDPSAWLWAANKLNLNPHRRESDD